MSSWALPMRLHLHGILLTSQFVPFLLYLLLSAILKLTLCLLTILPPRYTHPRASDSPCEVWRVTNCDLYFVLYCIQTLKYGNVLCSNLSFFCQSVNIQMC